MEDIATSNIIHTVDGKNGQILSSYTKDLVELSAALSGIQNAFFNRQGTVIVNPGDKSEFLESFRLKLKN